MLQYISMVLLMLLLCSQYGVARVAICKYGVAHVALV